ncbi:superoxide dismutase [Paraphysoderma sedebokerense]|nr:superoxide dismutase [Paraphysoderma sedebokerense]
MSHKLSALPYSLDALAPLISAETLDYHYNKHHAGYLTKMNAAIDNTPLKDLTLDEIIKKKDTPSVSAGVYNCAAQVWNHTFYWNSMRPAVDGNAPAADSQINKLITKSFGSFDDFKTKFSSAAGGHFGSGWAWLVQDVGTGALKIVDTHDAGCAINDPSVTPILTCDVWEHAYYIDFRNNRAKYVDSWWKLVNWDFAEKNLMKSMKL